MNELRHETIEGSPDDAPAPRPTREELRERLAAIRFWQVQGLDRLEVQRHAMAAWQVSQRTAQKYLRKAGRYLAHEAGREDQLSVLRLSQLQRERLLGHISKRLVDADGMEDKRLVLLVNAARTLLDGRDRAVKAMGQVQDVARNEAPQSERKPKPRANGPRKELENVARRSPSRPSTAASASAGEFHGKGVEQVHRPSQPTVSAGSEKPVEQPLALHTVASQGLLPQLSRTMPPHGAPASPAEQSPDERAMREHHVDIMEEMEAMIDFMRGKPRANAAMGRDPEAAHEAPQQGASALKSKPHKEMPATTVLVPDGT